MSTYNKSNPGLGTEGRGQDRKEDTIFVKEGFYADSAVMPAAGAKQKSAEEYFLTALSMLDGPGTFGSLTIANLCQALGVTKGSFYHHFAGWDQFVKALMAYWEDQQTERIMQQSHQSQTAIGHLEGLVQLASDVPHSTENAIRAWGVTEELVAQVQRRVDARRVAYVEVFLSYLCDDLELVKRLATMTVALFIGLQHIDPRPGSEQIRDILYGYLHEVVGPSLDRQTGKT